MTETNKLYLSPWEENAHLNLSNEIKNLITPLKFSEIVIAAIGSDRATGDSLGPLAGQRLKSLLNGRAFVYGSLDMPVHAKNLPYICEEIKEKHANPLIIAIDASVGAISRVGLLALGLGPIQPGAGVRRDLPQIGHVHVTGIVSYLSGMEIESIQNTRLQMVMKMAEVIADGVYYGLRGVVN